MCGLAAGRKIMRDMSTKPAVPEVALARGGIRAVISTSSAAVRELTVDGRPLLHSFAQGTHPPQAANIILAPWPNRVANAAFTFRGRRHELAVTEPGRGHAIHGFTVRRIFDIVEHSPDAAVLRTVLGPEPGWPWPIELTVRYALTESGLEASMTAVNLAGEPAPCALGVHTYLDAQGAPLDACTLHHTIVERQPVDARLIPAGDREPWPRSPIPMESTVLDDAGYDPLDRPHIARLIDDSGTGVELEATANLPWTQLFTSPQRHLAVEPMTAPPNALGTGEDLAVLAPGGALEVGWSVRAITSEN